MPPGFVAPAAQDDRLVGRTLAERYQVLEKMGEGGMGSVYRALHVTLEKELAVKVLHDEFSRKPELVERFLQEAKAASKIRHENVIDITDFGATPEGQVFFAMELLQGLDLATELARHRLDQRPFPWPRAAKIFLQVSSALSAAHRFGIIHRDLKPENIFLIARMGHEDFVKLLDFGIAKLTEVPEAGRKLTRTGMLFGTPEYMSPEQARGDAADIRVDVYAMGCILHQLISGRVPFEAGNFMGVLSMHLTEPPPRLTLEQLADVGAPPAIADVVLGALAKNRDDRYPTIEALADAVRAAGGDTLKGVTMPPPFAMGATGSQPAVRPLPGTGPAPVIAAFAESFDPSRAPRRRPPAQVVAGSNRRLVLGGAIAVLVAAGAVAGVLTLRRGADDGSVAAATVTIELATSPPGASVFDARDGSRLGTTPGAIVLEKAAAPRALRFELAGHAPRLIEVRPDKDRAVAETLEALEPVGQPRDGTLTDGKPRDGKPADGKPADGKPADGKPADGKPTDGKPTDSKPADGKPADGKPADGKPADGKPADGKPADGKPADDPDVEIGDVKPQSPFGAGSDTKP